MYQPSSDLFHSNLAYIAKLSQSLADKVSHACSNEITYRKSSTIGDVDLYFADERVIESCNLQLHSSFQAQLDKTDGVSVPRLKRKGSNSAVSDILGSMIDQHSEVLVEHLPAVSRGEEGQKGSPQSYRDLIIFGSLMLLPLIDCVGNSSLCKWISFTLVEDDPRQLAATLLMVDFEQLVKLCKKNSISFSIHIDDDKDNLQDRIYTQFSIDNPTLLYGWQTLRSPVYSPVLMQLHSWLHAPEGAAPNVYSMLGFATDEINQTQQALWNAISSEKMRVLCPNIIKSDSPVVLVASGPSLDDHLPWLNEHQKSLNIVASGSSLGTLLRSGICPSACVFLERGSEVYTDFVDVFEEGLSLDGITAFLSSTIDPRVPMLFEDVVFFHRPVAAATGLFPNDQQATLPIGGPHVVNAALEVLLSLGTREILLVGTDFAAVNRQQTRSEGALGYSNRDFSIPVRGNKRRTVFSEPGLLHTANLFDRVISSVSDCSVLRFGEGAELKSTTSIDPTPEITAQYTRLPGVFRMASATLPLSGFTREETSTLFDLIHNELIAECNHLKSSLSNETVWSKTLVEALVPYLRRVPREGSCEHLMLNRILCQPLFYSAMILHDADPEDPISFKEASLLVDSSIDLLCELILYWIDSMRPWLKYKNHLAWDHQWLRASFRKSSSLRSDI